MDTTTILAVGLLVCVVIAMLIVFRSSMNISFRLPGIRFDATGRNRPQPHKPGISIKKTDVGKDLSITDNAASGTQVEETKVGENLTVSAETPPQGKTPK